MGHVSGRVTVKTGCSKIFVMFLIWASAGLMTGAAFVSEVLS